MSRQGRQERQEERIEPSVETDRWAHATIGAAIEVHRHLGPGFIESLYERAFAIELERREIPFQRQAVFPIDYKGQAIGEHRCDLVIADRVVVELKAIERFSPTHVSQVISYLSAGDFELGLLINFNVVRLQEGLRRVVRSL